MGCWPFRQFRKTEPGGETLAIRAGKSTVSQTAIGRIEDLLSIVVKHGLHTATRAITTLLGRTPEATAYPRGRLLLVMCAAVNVGGAVLP